VRAKNPTVDQALWARDSNFPDFSGIDAILPQSAGADVVWTDRIVLGVLQARAK
jgi:hypothetical protein